MLVVLVLIVSLIASAAMLQAMGAVDFTQMLIGRLESVPAVRPHIAVYRHGLEAEALLAEERLKSEALQGEMVALQEQIELERKELEAEQRALARERAELDQWRRQLDAREATLAELDRKLKNLETLQRIYAEMNPADVVVILAQMEDEVIAQLLAGMEERQAGAILKGMDPAVAGRISKIIGGLHVK